MFDLYHCLHNLERKIWLFIFALIIHFRVYKNEHDLSQVKVILYTASYIANSHFNLLKIKYYNPLPTQYVQKKIRILFSQDNLHYLA